MTESSEFQKHCEKAYLGLVLILIAAAVLVNAYVGWVKLDLRFSQATFAILASTGLVLWVQSSLRAGKFIDKWKQEEEAREAYQRNRPK